MSTTITKASDAEAPAAAPNKKKATKADTDAPAPEARSYSLSNPKDVSDVAKMLKEFLKQNKLTTNVQGKEFVNVEGWQFAGSFFGLYGQTEHVINVSNDSELKYQAKVIVADMNTGRTVGCGIMCCSNKESGKKFYQEYAIMSMAATRAEGKAFRLLLAFLIRLAGFEGTPAEEMDYESAPKTAAPAPAPVMVLPENPATASPAVAVPVEYAFAHQKEEIIRLLNNPMIARQEKTKMLLNINRLDVARAASAIASLKKAITARENDPEFVPEPPADKLLDADSHEDSYYPYEAR